MTLETCIGWETCGNWLVTLQEKLCVEVFAWNLDCVGCHHAFLVKEAEDEETDQCSLGDVLLDWVTY